MAFLRNSWYCAGWSSDVGRTPIHRKILGTDIVLFRSERGRAIALGDKCPHRYAPLHQGRLNGDIIECPYHGLQYDATGSCVFNPFGAGKVPTAAKVPSYVVEERNGTVWLWMGEPEMADPDQIMDTSFLTNASVYFSKTGCHPVKSNYLLIVDNLLDLTHAQFLHQDTVGGAFSTKSWKVAGKGEGDDDTPEVWFEEDARSLTSHLNFKNKMKPPLWDSLVDSKRGDLYSYITWKQVSNLGLYLTYTPHDTQEEPASMIAMHFITPIDEMNSYYFIAVGWDARIDNQVAGDQTFDTVMKTVIVEDGPMIESCQAYMGDTSDLLSLKPVLLPTDAMAVKARRWVEEAIQDEKAKYSAR